MSVVKLDEVFIEFAVQSIENAPKGVFFWFFQNILGRDTVDICKLFVYSAKTDQRILSGLE